MPLSGSVMECHVGCCPIRSLRHCSSRYLSVVSQACRTWGCTFIHHDCCGRPTTNGTPGRSSWQVLTISSHVGTRPPSAFGSAPRTLRCQRMSSLATGSRPISASRPSGCSIAIGGATPFMFRTHVCKNSGGSCRCRQASLLAIPLTLQPLVRVQRVGLVPGLASCLREHPVEASVIPQEIDAPHHPALAAASLDDDLVDVVHHPMPDVPLARHHGTTSEETASREAGHPHDHIRHCSLLSLPRSLLARQRVDEASPGSQDAAKGG